MKNIKLELDLVQKDGKIYVNISDVAKFYDLFLRNLGLPDVPPPPPPPPTK